MSYYHENIISDNPEYRKIGKYSKTPYRKIGKYFKASNAESIADTYRDSFHDVVVAFAERRQGKFDFYSVWVRDIPLTEILYKELYD